MRSTRIVFLLFVFHVLTPIGSRAQTFETLVTFNGSNGGLPTWPLVQGMDGNLYGSTSYGGTGNQGTIFRITPAGSLTTLAGVSYAHVTVQASDGNFYGTTPYGGSLQLGSIFRINSAGQLTTLYNFCSLKSCADGQYPYGGVIEATDGNFYGTTAAGGTNNYGTVFRITPAGVLTTLVSFNSVGLAGTGVIEGTDGNFYGTTSNGGSMGDGTIFRVNRQGTLTVLHTFQFTDGKFPYDALIQGVDGNFYGTTYSGGGGNSSTCQGIGCGTIFKMTPSGTLTTLYNFCSQANCADGQWPSGGLVQGTDGSFYGTTQALGAYGESCPFGICGTVFKITSSGTLTTLHSFDTTDGSEPYAGLTQDTSGSFYGSTNMGADLSCGGGYGCGTLFRLAVGLGPFVETRPTAAKVGAAVIILGTNLTGATGVSFHGTQATFTVLSSSAIMTGVPAGATAGRVVVTTSGGTLKSNTVFRVITR